MYTFLAFKNHFETYFRLSITPDKMKHIILVIIVTIFSMAASAADTLIWLHCNGK